MKCRVDKSKLLVDNILRDYSKDEIDIMLLCDDEIDNAQKVFKYLIELFLKINENSTDDYINKLLIVIIGYIEFCNNIKYEMTHSEKEILNNFEQIYQDYLKRYSRESDINIINNLDKIKRLLGSNILSKNERLLLDKNLELSHLVELLEGKVDALNVQIKIYEDKVTKLDGKKNKLDKENQDLDKKIKNLKEELKSLKKLYNQLLLEKESLIQSNNDNNIDIESLQTKVLELHADNNSLNEQIKKLEIEIKDIASQLDEYKIKEEERIKEQELDNIILSKLFECDFIFYDLYTKLNEEGYNYTREEITSSLKRLKNKVCIINPLKKNVPIIYEVSSPLVTTNGNMEINNVTKTYDLLVTADWHLSPDIEIARTLGKVDSLYNYCVSNNINLILNLGDFLDVKPIDGLYDQYTSNMRLLESIVELFPKDKNIVQAILGGNHDRRMLKLGIDYLSYLENNRRDFINLGYDNATINFMRDYSSEFIGLHHPNTAGLQLDDLISVREEINNCLKIAYKDTEFSKKDVYIDLFGHFHLPRIDAANHYALVPALMKLNGQNTNGAFHLKIYFNENNTINYIVIKSIIPDRSFQCLGEHVYQKK